MIEALINEIGLLHDHTPDYEREYIALHPVLAKLPTPLPDDLTEYLDTCIPRHRYGSSVEFHDLPTLLEENRDTVPGADAIEQGFFCFAKEGDGSQFAYCTETHRIYHLGFTIGDTATDTRSGAWDSWDSFASFLEGHIADLRRANRLRQAEQIASPNDSSPGFLTQSPLIECFDFYCFFGLSHRWCARTIWQENPACKPPSLRDLSL